MRNYILQEKPDAVVNIIDARNVERGFYLTAQLLEMRVPPESLYIISKEAVVKIQA
jgi:Fe2+ transport system protein B